MRILLADDHSMFRESLRVLLEKQGFEIVAEAADGKEAAHLARRLEPDVAVLDVGMPVRNGIDAAREIGRRAPGTATILLTVFEEDAYVMGALQAGARGYVLKSQAAAELVKAIRDVARGSVYLSPGVSRTVVEACVAKKSPEGDPLTDRERHVLQLIAEGNTTRETAEILRVSFKTAESHRMQIMRKLDIHNTAGLVRYAIRRGLIRP
jgi:DNA-binding NarL/FixJ family response regulator